MALGLPEPSTNLCGFYMTHTVYSGELPVEIPRQPNESAKQTWDRLALQRMRFV
jgi:hypothetical protein